MFLGTSNKQLTSNTTQSQLTFLPRVKSLQGRGFKLGIGAHHRNSDECLSTSFLAGRSTPMLSKRWARVLYISTYILLIVGIGLALLVTGYDLIEQTLVLAQGGGRYFYIFILVGAYVATVLSLYPHILTTGCIVRDNITGKVAHSPQGSISNTKAVHAHQENRYPKCLPHHGVV